MRADSKEIPAVLIAGGMASRPAAMAGMMAEAFRGISKPQVAYVGAANNDNPLFFQMMKSLLLKAGAGKIVFVHLAKKKPDLETAKKALAGADVVFLSGGEVEDGMNWLKKHALVSYLKDLYSDGKRFLCLSAGVIMMGAHWVRWDKEGDDSTSELFDCLGIIPAVFDVHGEDEDWVELKAALKLMGSGSRAFALPRECMISADSRGTLINCETGAGLKKDYLTFENRDGQININEN